MLDELTYVTEGVCGRDVRLLLSEVSQGKPTFLLSKNANN